MRYLLRPPIHRDPRQGARRCTCDLGRLIRRSRRGQSFSPSETFSTAFRPSGAKRSSAKTKRRNDRMQLVKRLQTQTQKLSHNPGVSDDEYTWSDFVLDKWSERPCFICSKDGREVFGACFHREVETVNPDEYRARLKQIARWRALQER